MSAPDDQAQATATFRLIVVAAEAVGPEELLAELRAHAAGRQASVRVVAPAIVDTAFQHAAGDVDEGIERAQKRLSESADRLASEPALEVESFHIGDSDPMLAIGDALRTAPADEILIVTHADDEAGWMESDLFDRARHEFGLPISHLTAAGPGSRPGPEAIEHSDPGTDPEPVLETDPPLENVPKTTTRDLMGIGVAIFGTVALFALAANCISEPADTRTTACTVQLLIAGAVALINIAHVVGLVLFASVGYRGFAERFLSRSTLIGTPLALIAVLLIGLLAE